VTGGVRRTTRRHGDRWLWTLLLSITLEVGPGWAQDVEPSPVLEEVLVTATKREQNLQDVAVAVTALSGELIRELQINASEDLTFLVPALNLQKGNGPGTSSFSIRGIGTPPGSSAKEPSVSTMMDGVVLARSGQAFSMLWDVERVEVLRGPQGTLFGKNSSAGVVHIITRDPSEEHLGEIMGTIMEDDEYRAGLTLSGPVTDSLGYRFSAIGNDVDGYTRNYYDGRDLNGKEEWSVRGKLLWRPTEELDLKWTGDYSDLSCDCTASPIRSLEPFNGNEDYVQGVLDSIAPVVPGKKNQSVNIDSVPANEWSSWGNSLAANWEIGKFVLTSITAYRGWDADETGDADGQPTNVLGFDNFFETEQDQFTQELRITSPAEDRLSYVAGLYYYDHHIDFEQRREFEFVDGFPGIAIADFDVDTQNWAAFGEATWYFRDSWRFILGGRYTEDELDFQFARSQSGVTVGLPEPVAPTGGSTQEDDFSGKLALQWDYSDAGMTYLSYAQGYKGPAFDVSFDTDPVDLAPVNPETSDTWELGMKTSLFDDRPRLNTALFYSIYDDFQAQAFFDPDGIPDCPDELADCDAADDNPGRFILLNVGRITSKGLELDFLAQATQSLRLSGGLAILDAEIDDYPAGVCSGGQVFRGECPDGLQDLSGGDMPRSPDWKANLTASYFVPLNSLDIVFIASARAQDEVLHSLSQDENQIEDSYAIFDASVVFTDQNDRWGATAFVKNIGDKFYVSSINSYSQVFLANGYSHRYPKVAGRTYGLEMRYRW
jgi:iron complex outermembrane receptor protein